MSTVVPFSVFSERKRLLEESRRQGCEPLALATAELAAAKNLIRTLIFESPSAVREPLLCEAARLCGDRAISDGMSA